MSFYATQFRGETLAAVASGWTWAAGTRWVIADATQQNSRTFQCSGGSGVQSAYRSTFTIGSREDVDCLVFGDRQSGGLFDYQVDLNIPGATRGTGFTVRMRRTANAVNSCAVVADVLGGAAGTEVTGLADPFAWTWRVRLTWSGADATITVYALQADYSWSQVFTRTVTAPGASYESGVLGLHAVTTVGRVYINCMKVAAGPAAYVMLTRPMLDDTPFQRSTAAPHKLLVKGICGNMSGATVEGRFVTAGDPNPAWQVIDASPGTTFSGEIQTDQLGDGTVQVRPSTNTSAIDQIEGCRVCEIIIVIGQSNAQGRCADKHAFTPAGGVSDVLVWQAVIDGTAAAGHIGNQFWAARTDEGAGTTSRFIYQSANTEGTPWPLFFSELASRAGIQGAIIGHGEGTTGLASGTPTWQQGQTHYNRALLNLRRSGITKARCIFWVQGEYDSQQAATEDDYLTQLVALRNNMVADSGVAIDCFFGYCIGYIIAGSITSDAVARTQIDPVRAAVVRATREKAGFALGGNAYIIDLSDDTGDNLHYKSAADAQAFAFLYADAFFDQFYGTTYCGPKATSAYWTQPYSEFEVTFTRDIEITGDVAFVGTKVTVNGSEVAHTSAINGNKLTVTLTTPADSDDEVRVYYPTGNACANGGVHMGKFLAEDGDPGSPVFPFVFYVETAPPAGTVVRIRRGRIDRWSAGPSRLVR